VAILLIGVVAALLIALTLGFALLVEIRAVRDEIAHGNRTQRRVALVEGGRHRSSKRAHGERAGRRADHEDRIWRYAGNALDKLESIRALLASLVAPERAAVDGPAAIDDEEDEEDEAAADRLTSRLPEGPGEPPRYAPRPAPNHPVTPLAPLAHPDLIGSEDHADEAARSRLGPEDETPRRIGRAALCLPAFQKPGESA
jgi:hypothetical protein